MGQGAPLRRAWLPQQTACNLRKTQFVARTARGVFSAIRQRPCKVFSWRYHLPLFGSAKKEEAMSQISKQQVLDAFHFRASTRAYDPARTISEEDFNYILELARLSPSSVGSEPWKLLVIQNPALRQTLKPVCWGMATQVDDASHLVVLLARKNARYDSEFFREVMARRGLQGEQAEQAMQRYKKFQSEDAGVLQSERSLFDWASKQTYIALANMLTGVTMIGIDLKPINTIRNIILISDRYNAAKLVVNKDRSKAR